MAIFLQRTYIRPFTPRTYHFGPMIAENSGSDIVSVFSYDEGDPDSFNLSQLNRQVAEHLGKACTLVKMDEGGNHKVYDVIGSNDSRSLNVVVRVASPAFPRDKLLSEVATLKYIAAHTSVPVPRVFAWNADASNPVGAEYMIIQKIAGIPPWGDKWRSLPITIKLNVVRQVAEHIAILFSQRFGQAGSLYLTEANNPGQIAVGPIVSLPFYRAIDGTVEFLNMPSNVRQSLDRLRGPFSRATDYLASFLKAPLLTTKDLREQSLAHIDTNNPDVTLDNARKTMQLALELCQTYPGDQLIPSSISSPDRPFTIMLDDFQLGNILIDESTGQVNGYIDFEGTAVVPVWQSAEVPSWIPNPDGDTANWYGGTPEDQRALWDMFHNTINHHDQALTGGEWRKAFEQGEPFRRFATRLAMGVQVWGEQGTEVWVKQRLEWSKEHPGVGMPDPDEY